MSVIGRLIWIITLISVTPTGVLAESETQIWVCESGLELQASSSGNGWVEYDGLNFHTSYFVDGFRRVWGWGEYETDDKGLVYEHVVILEHPTGSSSDKWATYLDLQNNIRKVFFDCKEVEFLERWKELQQEAQEDLGRFNKENKEILDRLLGDPELTDSERQILWDQIKW